ncbi:hypothetical protein CROQUDRAFT_672343 [Cronartium quercuum f. sp. fusiforme G11]|uniref:Aquaporin-like protein n=1 Tax=Cronartium quercuum f. sp. fusiforme G11 TaxID=708437 RepID=A0A9P6NJ23_9BASI|nr:hypothetical protein CROQUDRAFT_672343 [Cronartium quercuum f. sp. fusiforme G11]
MSQTKFNWDQIKPRPAEGYFSEIRSDLVGALGEFLGSLTFLLMGLGGIQAAATSNTATLMAAANEKSPSGSTSINTVATIDQLMFIAASMGLSLLGSAWIFYRATGAAFNPNVSLSLLLVGVISPVRFVLYSLAQMAASITACALLQAILPGPLTVTPSLGAGTTTVQGIFIESFTTAALILSVLFLAVEKHRATFIAPIGVALTLFSGHLFATVYTGAAMNTARAFGPSVITGFGTDHW